jgi:Lrp/AsnC family leucine-responsive transcriptional regulator
MIMRVAAKPRIFHAFVTSFVARFLPGGPRRAYLMRMSASVSVDEVDRRILDLLRQDARRSVADIAARVSLTPAPVKRRIDRLERLGVIIGYTVVLDDEKIGPAIDAFTELRVAGDVDIDDVIATIRDLPEVREAFTIAGDPDALIHIRVDDVHHLKRVVNGLRRSGRVTGTKTMMVLDRWSSVGTQTDRDDRRREPQTSRAAATKR